MKNSAAVGRRHFIAAGAATALIGLAAPAEAARRLLTPRSLTFDHIHTGERLSEVYWADGRYLPDALHRIDWLLRDFRTNEMRRIDPALLDILADLEHKLGARKPIQVFSGYRSPQTNEMLASLGDGVAQNSLHIEGMAIDIHIPGRNLNHVRRAAMALRRGGVGYYPRSNFVHIDTGRVRYW
jgi:uncharacterized protein YcbK (DUF882 family)